MQRPTAVNETNTLRPGAIFEDDIVVGKMPNGEWLLMAPHDTHNRLEWGCWGERIGTNSTGLENTDKLLKAGSPAAIYCRTALDKSYDLPSREELAMLYQQRDLLGLEGLGWAWSSTEFSRIYSWNQSFSSGYPYNYYKDVEYWVVPVRRIPPPAPPQPKLPACASSATSCWRRLKKPSPPVSIGTKQQQSRTHPSLGSFPAPAPPSPRPEVSHEQTQTQQPPRSL